MHHSLLRIPTLHLLRAMGFHSTRPSVLDALTSITANYMLLLSQTTARYTFESGRTVPELEDMRRALEEVGALPSSGVEGRGEDWLAGEGWENEEENVDEFIMWVKGTVNGEIRRIAGLEAERIEGEVELEGDDAKEDFLTGMLTFCMDSFWSVELDTDI